MRGVADRSLCTRNGASLLQLISCLRKEFKRQMMTKTCITVSSCSLQIRAKACWKDTTGETRMNSGLMHFLSSSLPSTGKPHSSITNNLIPDNITSVYVTLIPSTWTQKNQHLARLPPHCIWLLPTDQNSVSTTPSHLLQSIWNNF